MQWVTHSFIGVVLQRSVERTVPKRPLQIATIVVAGALSHVVIDDLARMTYHPRASIIADWTPFLVIWFTFVMVVGAFAFWHFRRYWIGMLAAVIPDADWVIFRPLAWMGCAPSWWYEGWTHDTMRSLPGPVHFHEFSEHFPDLRETPAGIMGEVIVALVIVWFLIRRKTECNVV